MSRRLRRMLLIFAVSVSCLAGAEAPQRFENIGDLRLTSGKVLKDCRIGYRTFGKMNAKRDNVVLFTTWFLGKTSDLQNSFGPKGLIDTGKLCILAVDALCNGVSSSPSNSAQKDGEFPEITIRDMVESQRKLLAKLRIKHLRAVTGISMGGMQAFTWATAYPQMMDAVIPIVGSPQPTSYDTMLYQGSLDAIEGAIRNPAAKSDLIRVYADFFWMALATPTFYAKHTPPKDAVPSMRRFADVLMKWNLYDMRTGLRALLTNRAHPSDRLPRMLIIVASQDHCVNPGPALAFANKWGFETLVLESEDGHSSPSAALPRVRKAIARVLGAGSR